MAQSASAKKRIKQSEAAQVRNRARKSVVKTQVRKFTDAIRAGEAEKAQAELRGVVKKLDQNAAKGVVHKNAVARTKSRLTKRLNKMIAESE